VTNDTLFVEWGYLGTLHKQGELKELTNLLGLSLCNTGVADKGLKYLSGLKSFEELDFGTNRGRQITDLPTRAIPAGGAMSWIKPRRPVPRPAGCARPVESSA
jgi:hypothetical protein